MGHGRALLAVEGPEQSKMARQVAERGLSVRETEELVRRQQAAAKGGKKKSAGTSDPDIRRLEGELSERLGAKVHLQQGSGGRGKLVIEYHSNDELEGILDRIH